MARRTPPDAELIRDLRLMVAAPKVWISADEIPWVDAGGKPRGLKFRASLSVNGVTPASLFAQGYYKPATIAGVPDKLSLGLFYRNARVLGLDEDGFSNHRNSAGAGRPYYLQRVGHPHLHTVSDDGIDDYAEPLDPATFHIHWETFVAQASITGAPVFNLPPGQRELLLR